jgi:hypothetical protein
MRSNNFMPFDNAGNSSRDNEVNENFTPQKFLNKVVMKRKNKNVFMSRQVIQSNRWIQFNSTLTL